jgi:hypothetical protein
VDFEDTEAPYVKTLGLHSGIDWHRAEVPQSVCINGEEFEVMPLTGDGGYQAVLVLEADRERFVKALFLKGIVCI